MAEPSVVVPLMNVTVPAGAGAPVTTGMLNVIGSAVPTVVGLFVTTTASFVPAFWFTTTVVVGAADAYPEPVPAVNVAVTGVLVAGATVRGNALVEMDSV